MHVLCNGVCNGRSRSSNVIDIGTNRKQVCNYFLLVMNSNLGLVLSRLRDIVRATLPIFTRMLEVCGLDFRRWGT